jgi:hypothetical protein
VGFDAIFHTLSARPSSCWTHLMLRVDTTVFPRKKVSIYHSNLSTRSP